MSEQGGLAALEQRALEKARRALRLTCAELPHLSGLARAVRLQVEWRTETAGVFASGRLVFNPAYLDGLILDDAVFLMAHELLHLALESHERGRGSEPFLVNVAHDYIINDLLAHELGRPVPAGLLIAPGARLLSLERLLVHLRGHRDQVPSRCLSRSGEEPGGVPTLFGHPLPGLFPGGLQGQGSRNCGDVLEGETEREWYPGEDSKSLREQARHIVELAGQAAGLGVILGRLAAPEGSSTPWGRKERTVEALRGGRPPSWESALQRWLDAVVPDPRTYARPSRRQGERGDVVLAGRRREGWTLHVVLDTSGSMWPALPRVLGALATFCQASAVDLIRLIQCDVEVTADDWLRPEELARFCVRGFSGWEGEQVPEEPKPPPPEPPSAPVEEPPPPAREEPPVEKVEPPRSPWVPAAVEPPRRQWLPPREWERGSWYVPPRGSGRIRWRGIRRRRRPQKPIFFPNKGKPKPTKPPPAGRPPFDLGALGGEAPPGVVAGPDSDLSPALLQLARESEVGAVVVLTDGLSAYPAAAPPYKVLWIIPDEGAKCQFAPRYGSVVALGSGER